MKTKNDCDICTYMNYIFVCVGPRGVASDGKYLYVLSSQGLMKVGSGYGGTVKGVVYKLKPDFLTEESNCWIGFASVSDASCIV